MHLALSENSNCRRRLTIGEHVLASPTISPLHRAGFSSFTSRYNAHKLVYFEEYHEIADAAAREKQLKGGSRRGKVALIDGMNPDWRDLSGELTVAGT